MEIKLELPSYKCAVCRSMLIIYENSQILKCRFCESMFATIVTCEEGHFVCPTCADIHADPSEFDTTEEYEKARNKALSEYKDRDKICGTIGILMLSTVPPDRAEELGDLYDHDDFDKEEL